MVEFQEDNKESTTGTGKFLNVIEGIDCEKSSFNNVAMMYLCWPTAVLLHPCCYQKEGELGHF